MQCIREKAHPTGSLHNNPPVALYDSEHNGDLMIRNLLHRSIDSIHDMRVANTYSLYHQNKSPEKCLHMDKKEKKNNYLESCIQKFHHLSPFIVLVEGILGVEAEAPLTLTSIQLVTKWKQPYYRTCIYVKIRFASTLAKATHRCILGSQVPAHKIIVKRPHSEDRAGLYLFQ